MSLILEGLTFGLILAVSLGPIFIALTQTSIEKGTMPGLTVGSGIWISDLLFMMVFYKFIHTIKATVESTNFNFWMGLSGAIILFLFGLVLILKKPALNYDDLKYSRSDYLGFWLKGFLINTINPFTFIFWMGIISTYVIGRNLPPSDVSLFLGTIFLVIVLSDSLKVYLALKLKNWLTPHHINIVSNVSGVILVISGIFLAYKVW